MDEHDLVNKHSVCCCGTIAALVTFCMIPAAGWSFSSAKPSLYLNLLLLFLGIAIAQVVPFLIGKRMMEPRIQTPLFAISCTILVLSSCFAYVYRLVLDTVSPFLSFPVLFLASVAEGILLFYWVGNWFCMFRYDGKRDSITLLVLSTIAAFLAADLLLYLPKPISQLIALGFCSLVSSFSLFYYFRRYRNKPEVLQSNEDTSYSANQIRPKAIWATLGIYLVISAETFSQSETALVFFTAMVAGNIIFFLMTMIQKRIPHFSMEIQITFFMEVLLILSMFPCFGLWILFGIGLLGALNWTITICAVFFVVDKRGTRPINRVAKRLLITASSFTFGIVVGGAIIYFVPESSILLVAGCIALFILILTHLTDPREWSIWGMIYQDINEIEEEIVDPDFRYANQTLLWEHTCQDIAAQNLLSNRETEVFLLLAKGRNTASIAEKLYISPHTAHTHVYNVYKKLDVHSQQELLSYVEQEQDKSQR